MINYKGNGAIPVTISPDLPVGALIEFNYGIETRFDRISGICAEVSWNQKNSRTEIRYLLKSYSVRLIMADILRVVEEQ